MQSGFCKHGPFKSDVVLTCILQLYQHVFQASDSSSCPVVLFLEIHSSAVNTQSGFTVFEVRTTWHQLLHGKQMASSIWGVFPTWLSCFTFTLISQQTLSTFTARFNVKTKPLIHSVNNLRSYPKVMAFRIKWNWISSLAVFQLKQYFTLVYN